MMGATIKSGDGWSYTLTEEDKLWAARMARYEGGSPADVLWTMAQGYARPSIHRRYPTFTRFIQAYSQPINPKWRRDGEFCRPGGEYAGRDNCAERRLAVRDTAATISWGELPAEIRSAVSEWFSGSMPNPVPKAVEFAAPNVSESFLTDHPDARVIKRLDNWYLSIRESQDWPDGWVTMAPGVPWMAVGLAVLLGGVGAYAVSRRRVGRGLFGLEGTVAEHRVRATEYIRSARGHLLSVRGWMKNGESASKSGTPGAAHEAWAHALNNLQAVYASLGMAEAEARWLPGDCKLWNAESGTICGTVAALQNESVILDNRIYTATHPE